jgi:hypothetical protein
MEVAVNGKAQEFQAAPGGLVSLRRTWRNGDRVTVRMPMSLRTEPLPGTPNQVAFLYGPVVLAGRLGTNDLPNPYIARQTEQVRLPVPEVPVLVTTGDLLRHVEPVPGRPLTFRTRDLAKPREVELKPFYRVHHERYTVYWQTATPEAYRETEARREQELARSRALDARTLDVVHPGEQQSEIDHDVRSASSSTGSAFGRGFRHAPDGSFSYRLKVNDGQPAVLVVTYWGGETGAREFEVVADGRVLATQQLKQNRPGEFFDVSYPLTPELTQGKSGVTFTFRAKPGNIAGGVFGLRVLKPE